MTTTDAAATRRNMVEDLRRRGYLDDPRWYRAFAEVPREAFLAAGFLRQSPGPGGPAWTPVRPGSEGYLSEIYHDAPVVTQVGGHTTPPRTSKTVPPLPARRPAQAPNPPSWP